VTRQSVIDEERTYIDGMIALRGLDVVEGPTKQAPSRAYGLAFGA
jgi:hypothetical protein